jgi:hypothetical protein
VHTILTALLTLFSWLKLLAFEHGTEIKARIMILRRYALLFSWLNDTRIPIDGRWLFWAAACGPERDEPWVVDVSKLLHQDPK